MDTGDQAEFLTDYDALQDFRKANAGYEQANFAGLGGDERIWEKASRPSQK